MLASSLCTLICSSAVLGHLQSCTVWLHLQTFRFESFGSLVDKCYLQHSTVARHHFVCGFAALHSSYAVIIWSSCLLCLFLCYFPLSLQLCMICILFILIWSLRTFSLFHPST